ATFASGSGANLGFTPDDNGTYVATLTATDKDGAASAPATTTITVDNVAPTAAITGAPLGSTPGAPITLGSAVTDPSPADTVAGLTYAWNVTKDGAAFASGNSPAITFTPDAAATYVATLTATDKDGGVATASVTILVAPLPTTPLVASAGPGVTANEG